MKYETENRPCDICGSTDNVVIWEQVDDATTRVIKNDDGTLVNNVDVLCMGCRHVFKNPSMTDKSLDKFYAEEYADLFKPEWKKSISRTGLIYTLGIAVQNIEWLVKNYDVVGKDVLEVGAGDGMFMKALESHGANVVGIDQDPRAIEIAGKLHGYKIEELDFLNMPESTRGFDLVSIRNTLEHMYSPVCALQKAVEIIRDDGAIFVEVPLSSRPYPGQPIGAFLSGAHMCTFSMESFQKMVDDCGLHIESYAMEGHKGCLMAVLKKGKQAWDFVKDKQEYLRFLQERYKEHNNTYFKINEINLELFQPSNVSISIEKIKSYKHTSNWIAFTYLTQLLTMPNQMDKIANLLDNYQWDYTQAPDENCCPASVEYIRGIFYREMGDFDQAKMQFEKAKSMYPQYLRHNFVKELILDGVVSESVFNNYLWFSCERFMRAMG